MTQNRHNPAYLAPLYMVFSMAIIGVIDNYVAVIAETVSVWQFHFMRTVVSLPLLMLLPFLGLGRLRPKRFRAVLLRSFLISSSMILYFSSLAFMPIAQALAGLFTSPIFVLLITALGLKRALGPWRILAVVFGFAGTLFVLQPGGEAFDIRVLLPVAAGLLYAFSSITTRELCFEESTACLLSFSWLALGAYGAVGLIVLEVISIPTLPGPDGFLTRSWTNEFAPMLPLLAVQVIGSLIGVYLLTKAYQIGETSYVAPFEYSVMIFGPAWGWIVFANALNLFQLSGLALIVISGLILAARSRVHTS